MRAVVFVCAVLGACGSSGSSHDAATVDDVAPPLDGTLDADDGTPMRQPCTSQLGNALTSVYGRLDADIAEGAREDGTPCCLLILKNELVPVRPTPRRAFQGWRYLDPAEAPEDLEGRSAAGIGAMPPRLRRQLAELGLI